LPRGSRGERLKAEEVRLLRLLAGSGAAHTPVALTSRELGAKLGVSQQGADRYLVALADKGFLTRVLAQRRQRIELTAQALELLRSEYETYRRIFEGPAVVRFSGTVVSGLGEGRYYLSQPGYVVQFVERLGYEPYPGTLNVRVSADDLPKVSTVRRWKGLRIDGFKASGRTFGGATCFPARLSGRTCHAIVPDRTHHQDVVEFIAPEFLRGALELKDGGPIDVEIRET
jgi:riboflavin kinase, archaea type